MTQQLPILQNPMASPQRIVQRWGWEIPAEIHDHDQELWESGAGFLDVSFLGAVFLNGPDRADYLNRRCSQKVLGLKQGEHQRACILNGVGKIDADFDVYQDEFGDRFLLLTSPYKASQLAAEIDKYLFSEDCQVEPIESPIALATRAIPAVFKGKHFLKLDSEVEAYLLRSDVFAGCTICLLPSGSLQQAVDLLTQACGLASAQFVGWNAFENHRIKLGRTFFGADLSETTIPLEANLNRALHDDKGCYPGQETIATIINLGHPARRFLVFQSKRPLIVGTPILSGPENAEVGQITSATEGDYAPYYAIGFVKWRFRDGHSPLFAGEVPLQILYETETQVSL